MDKEDYFLPKEIECPHCKNELKLEDEDRIKGNFVCPICNENVTEKDLLRSVYRADISEEPVDSNSKQTTSGEQHKGSGLGFGIFLIIPSVIIFAVLVIITGDKSTDERSTASAGLVNKESPTTTTRYRHKKYVHQNINIRSGRGTDFKVVGTLYRGAVVEVDSFKNGWYVVYQRGVRKGYVYSDLLKSMPLPDFEIVSWNWNKDRNFGGNGAVIWNVQIRNNTSSYVRYLKVEFTTYDAGGNIIDTDFTYVKGLSPGGTASAKGYATYFGREEKAGIRIVR